VVWRDLIGAVLLAWCRGRHPAAQSIEREAAYLKAKKQQFFDSSDVASGETVRAVIRLISRRKWSLEEIKEAFYEPPEK
jgi:hypothetical protein